MAAEPVDLDLGQAQQVALGAKAEALARARGVGLPVLPGFVVPAEAGRNLVASLVGAVAQEGPHAASLRLMEAAQAVDLSAAVVAASRLGARLAVRSSSTLEDDPAWSGAFSSFLDVQPHELPTAVAGCWASTFTPAVLERCDRTGVDPVDACPAVLVQPMVQPRAGGTARVEEAGDRSSSGAGGGAEPRVEVVGVLGSPAPLLAGWASGDELPEAWTRAVAELALRAAAGWAATIEWAIVDEDPVLLQIRRDPPQAVGRWGRHQAGDRAGHQVGRMDLSAAWTAAPLAAVAPALARAVARFGGPLGDELVLPWMLASLTGPALTGPALTGPAPAGGDPYRDPDLDADPDLVVCLDRTVDAARALVCAALGAGGGDAAAHAGEMLDRVAGGDLEALASAHPVTGAAGRRVLAGFDRCAALLRATGALAHEEQLWALTLEEVRRRLDRPGVADWHAHRFRTLRWQPVLRAVLAGCGRTTPGQAAAPGSATGWARRVASEADLRQVVPGDVVVLERPFPQAAPALWVASAVVAESGSTAAHLVEVARSLRVPAVVAAGTVPVEPGETLAYVDGDAGIVRVLGP